MSCIHFQAGVTFIRKYWWKMSAAKQEQEPCTCYARWQWLRWWWWWWWMIDLTRRWSHSSSRRLAMHQSTQITRLLNSLIHDCCHWTDKQCVSATSACTTRRHPLSMDSAALQPQQQFTRYTAASSQFIYLTLNCTSSDAVWFQMSKLESLFSIKYISTTRQKLLDFPDIPAIWWNKGFQRWLLLQTCLSDGYNSVYFLHI